MIEPELFCGLSKIQQFYIPKKIDIPENILQKFTIIAEHYNITVYQLFDKSRKRPIVTPRNVCFWYVCNYMKNKDLILKTIGSFLNKNHATVLNAKKTVNNLMDTDKCFKEDLICLLEKLGKSLPKQEEKPFKYRKVYILDN